MNHPVCTHAEFVSRRVPETVCLHLPKDEFFGLCPFRSIFCSICSEKSFSLLETFCTFDAFVLGSRCVHPKDTGLISGKGAQLAFGPAIFL